MGAELSSRMAAAPATAMQQQLSHHARSRSREERRRRQIEGVWPWIDWEGVVCEFARVVVWYLTRQRTDGLRAAPGSICREAKKSTTREPLHSHLSTPVNRPASKHALFTKKCGTPYWTLEPDPGAAAPLTVISSFGPMIIIMVFSTYSDTTT